MKYSITGHTYGIGQAVFKRLSPHAIGFSRSTGFDISNPDDRQRIIELSQNTDVFINNAQHQFDQTILFLELWEKWKNDPKKIIINIGSNIADIEKLPLEKYKLVQYQAEKILLKEMSKRVSGSCKIKYVSFGYVGTEKILKKYPHLKPNEYITEDDAATTILQNLS